MMSPDAAPKRGGLALSETARALSTLAMMLSLAACGRFGVEGPGSPMQEAPVSGVEDRPEPDRASTLPRPTMHPADLPDVQEEIPSERKTMTDEGKVSLIIAILFDNNPYDERLTTAWGFSALVERGPHRVLIDTGGDCPILLSNMKTLGIDPASIEAVVLSHAHKDHTGGLESLLALGLQPIVYVLPSFSSGFKAQVGEVTQVVEVAPGQVILDGIFTTGEVVGEIPEQALVVTTEEGLVVITGCAHPGIDRMLQKARFMFGGPIRLAMGGFHLKSADDEKVSRVLRAFRDLGVESTAPCHCTGDRARGRFAAEYGEGFIQAGVGKVIVLPGG